VSTPEEVERILFKRAMRASIVERKRGCMRPEERKGGLSLDGESVVTMAAGRVWLCKGRGRNARGEEIEVVREMVYAHLGVMRSANGRTHSGILPMARAKRGKGRC